MGSHLRSEFTFGIDMPMNASTPASEFPVRLHKAMAARDINGATLAEAVGVTPGAVSQWLNVSSPKPPRRDTAEQIAAFLGVDRAWLELGVGTGPVPDLREEREAYLAGTGWRFREMPSDMGMDFGN